MEKNWVHPRWDRELHFAYPPEPDAVDAACRAATTVKGVLLITPTD